jgi:hypothetical protein
MAWLAAMRLSVSSCFGAGRPNSPSGILDAPSAPNVRLPKSPPPVFEVLASSGATIAAGLPNTAFMLPLVDGGAELPNVLCPEDWGAGQLVKECRYFIRLHGVDVARPESVRFLRGPGWLTHGAR